MESKGILFILIIVVAVLTLTLAALTGYLFILQGASNAKDVSTVDSVDGPEVVRDIPKKEDRITIPLYEGKRIFNLKNVDSNKVAMMQVSVSLDCYKQLKINKKVIVEEKVTAYLNEIQEIVVRFFLTKTSADVKDVAVMDNAKEDLTKQINELLNEGVKQPEDIVYNVIFSEWLFQ